MTRRAIFTAALAICTLPTLLFAASPQNSSHQAQPAKVTSVDFVVNQGHQNSCELVFQIDVHTTGSIGDVGYNIVGPHLPKWIQPSEGARRITSKDGLVRINVTGEFIGKISGEYYVQAGIVEPNYSKGKQPDRVIGTMKSNVQRVNFDCTPAKAEQPKVTSVEVSQAQGSGPCSVELTATIHTSAPGNVWYHFDSRGNLRFSGAVQGTKTVTARDNNILKVPLQATFEKKAGATVQVEAAMAKKDGTHDASTMSRSEVVNRACTNPAPTAGNKKSK